jgi:acetyltransferase EpsM
VSLRSVILIGAGGHGKSVLSILRAMGIEVTAIFDDDPTTWGKAVLGVPVRGSTADLKPDCTTPVVLGIGDNLVRKRVVERFPDVEWATVVYPGAYVASTAQIGRGSVVFPFAVVAAEAGLGSHVIVSSHCTMGHDTRLGDYAQAAPGVQVAGGSTVGEGVLLAIGSVVCPGVTIGEWATLAAGAVAVYDVPPRCTAYGVPATPRVPGSAPRTP